MSTARRGLMSRASGTRLLKADELKTQSVCVVTLVLEILTLALDLALLALPVRGQRIWHQQVAR